MEGGPIRSVLPTTTATALTSLTTGMPPGEHGIVGYRIHVHGEVLNVLRWTTAAGDARQTIPPQKVQPNLPFLGHRPPVITKAEFARTGFTQAHLDGVRFTGYRMPSSLVTEVARLTRASEPFVYAYYDGVDKVSHEYGLGVHYDAEVAAADRLVGDVLAAVPTGTAVVVVSDHGQVEVGDRRAARTRGDRPRVAAVRRRTVPLAARPTRPRLCAGRGERRLPRRQAWVRTRDEVVDGGWFGPHVSADAAGPPRRRRACRS